MARETAVKRRRETIPFLLASAGIVASGVTRSQCRRLKRDQGGTRPAAAARADATVSQVRKSPADEDSFCTGIRCGGIEWTECANPGR